MKDGKLITSSEFTNVYYISIQIAERFVFVKPVFHFNRIVAKRTVFHCFVNTQAELMIWTQKNTLRFATIRLEWKTVLNL